MVQPLTTEKTNFTRDILGRYLCNTWEEAIQSTNARPDARPFDVIVVGGGSFGSVLAQSLFHDDATQKRRRILVLEAGLLAVPEHVQNLPVVGLGVPGATSIADLRAAGQDGNPRLEFWGLPWHSSTRFTGLAYCLGGRSIYFGGWSPRLLDAELAGWPADVVDDLKSRYFDEAAEQIGTSKTNDFIFGPLHTALRQQLFDDLQAGEIPGAVPLAELPLHLDDVLPGEEEIAKLEAPLAVETHTRAGCFPSNKFSALPLLMKAARVAYMESNGDDVKKRLMVVPDVHVTRLVTAGGRVTRVETQRGSLAVPENGIVVLAASTIENARLALLSFAGVPNDGLIGRNLMAHLRSNLTIRIPRSSIAGLDSSIRELEASALFIKGRHQHADGDVGHFHLQITAAGLDKPGADSEAELFKKIPDVDTFQRFQSVDDNVVVVTIRGIGEMEPQNPGSSVRLDPEPDEFGVRRAFVSIGTTARDQALWDALDRASDDVALVLANGKPYEVLGSGGFIPVAAGQPARDAVGFTPPRRDVLGTTHHETGTLWMGEDPTTSVTDPDGRFHHVANAYALGPCLFPSIGSPNPMLTGVAMTRRMSDRFIAGPPLFTPGDGFTALFDGRDTSNWRMAGEGGFFAAGGILEAVPGNGLGLYWHTLPTPADFTLVLEWMSTQGDDNSGVHLRFPHPDSKGYQNTAWVAVDFGLEVQIDELARPDGADRHRTGAIYNQQNQTFTPRPALPPGRWNTFEIRVQGQRYTVLLNGQQTTDFRFVEGSDAAHPDRALPSAPGAPRFIGLQAHTGRVRYRNIRLKG
ncbi:MAG TPA: family 16 glycoside hydrolase [Thermoanaerobaculia bacterium]|nr:family 16 glycoside hydrolase [Thermoanaerobaculia bacterium]